MLIRRARAADVPVISDLVQRAYAPYIERIGRRPAPMDTDYARKIDQGQVFVAKDAGVVGFVVLVLSRDHLLVENVAVAPERQGEGIGRALLEYAEAAAREAGLSTLRLYTNAAMSENLVLYPHLGWQEVERRSEHGFERVFFRKRLGL